MGSRLVRDGVFGLALLALAAPADAAVNGTLPFLSGPNDASQMIATFNQLIQSINGITGALLPAGGGTATNGVSLPPGVTGAPAGIGVQIGGDPNASITINPNGNGNVILFGPAQSGSNSTTALGMLQIGNQAGIVPATGFAACPGVIPGRGRPGPIVTAGAGQQVVEGPGATVTGYLQILDWLGRVRSIPVCG